jgi:transposase-like protein
MKAAILKRVLPPNNESIVSVSQDTGVARATISYWKKRAADGILEVGDEALRPSDRSPAEKLTLLLESRGVEEQQHGEWLRSHGLHTEHLPLWEQELRDIVTEKEKKRREELAELKRKNKELEKELQRKDKALAETAALLALKKKAEAIWGDDEED